MNNLLIFGAGIYGTVSKEVAEAMNCFDKIAFIDDNVYASPTGNAVIGTRNDLGKLAAEYQNIFVAIGNPEVRFSLLRELEEIGAYTITTLISPKAYVSPSAKIEDGCIVEPMAVVHSCSVLKMGCIVSAGAVVNHSSVCGECAHIDCNATVKGYSTIPSKLKVESGTVIGKL